MPKKINIKPWLNDHLFQRVDLHPIFEGLYKSGADLNYILFLCGVFLFWDYARQQLGFNKRRGLIPFSQPNTKPNGQQRLSEIMRPLEALRDPVKLQKFLDIKGESDMWFCAMNQFLDGLSDACVKAPLWTLFVRFGYPREFFKGKGDPGDPWGNFFLLAVTEHLGAVDRGWKSKHVLAYRLLTMLRKDSVSIENPKVSAAARMAVLKRKEPQWQAALSLLESEFSKLKPPPVLVS